VHSSSRRAELPGFLLSFVPYCAFPPSSPLPFTTHSPFFCLRQYANLEADVEIDLPEIEPEPSVVDEPLSESALGLSLVSREPDMDAVEEVDEPASRAPSIRNVARPGGSRRSSVAALTTALNETARRGNSRPASIAPSVREDGAGPEGPSSPGIDEAEDEEQEVIDVPLVTQVSFSSTDPSSSSSDPSSSSASAAIPLSIGSSSSHLSPPTDDLYASLANAATPPNNTFLSTLAESGAAFSGSAASAAAAFFARNAPARPVATGPPASGGGGMGSLDAVMAGEAGPSKVSLGTTNSGRSDDGEASAEGEGEGEGDDAATQEAGSQQGEDQTTPGSSSSPVTTGAGKGKGKEREVEVEELVGSREEMKAATVKKEKTVAAELDEPDVSMSAAVALLF
jgi:hypothetical protein